MKGLATTITPTDANASGKTFRWGPLIGPLVLPLSVLTYIATGPHPWYASLVWGAAVAAALLLDGVTLAGAETPTQGANRRALELLLYVLVGLHLLNILALAHRLGKDGLFSFDALLSVVLVGVTSGYSAVITGHELIHRREHHHQVLGRILLWTAFYDRFFVDHLRGHHARAATDEDPATARFGETFLRFTLRTVPAEFRSAWELEARRLAQPGLRRSRMDWLRRHSMVQGFVAELALLAGLLGFFGAAALAGFVLQALLGQLLIASVNYFEHWGLRRVGRKSSPSDAWDCDSNLSRNLLLNLPRHPDHHMAGTRPYYLLRSYPESPRLPHGYIRMIFLVIFANGYTQRILTAELKLRGLGPFSGLSSASVANSRST